MSFAEVERSSTTNGLPVAPELGASLASINFPHQEPSFNSRTIIIALECMGLAVIAVFIAQLLQHLIALITNISFFGTIAISESSPATNQLGLGVILVPVVGGILVGIMARYGSSAIRGHGIPEAMEQVLSNESRIHPFITFLKPISAAIAIGTGGPFGAEGPIIATGGALGSVFGQFMPVTANERKVLLTAGAAAGMTAIFGTPIAAILLAIELLLFEFKARSIIPVALAVVTAAGVRLFFVSPGPVWPMPALATPTTEALAIYLLIGAIVGVCSVFVSKSVYLVEELFEKLPIHWMWWPAIGAVAVGVCGYFVPKTLGVGYENITTNLSGSIALQAVLILCVVKFISWSISLGSGTSGGTMAPMFTIGSALGLLLGALALSIAPNCGVDIRMAALIGMAALFAGATRALLTSVVMAFETTLQPVGLLPLIGACSAAYAVSSMMMKNTIMTEKIVRRGIKVPADYQADFLDSIQVKDLALNAPVSLQAAQTIAEIRTWMQSGSGESSHQGFPVLDNGKLIGVITRRDIFSTAFSDATAISAIIHKPLVCIYENATLREAADHMVNHDVGRLPVLSKTDGFSVIGFITRSDLLMAHKKRLSEHYRDKKVLRFKTSWSS